MAFDVVGIGPFGVAVPVKRARLNTSDCVPRSGFISVSALLLLFAVAVVVLVSARQWNPALLLLALFVIVLVLVGNGLAARSVARSLQPPAFFRKPEEFGRSTAIVLLGDGTIVEPGTREVLPRWLASSRIECAARLYHAAVARGAACRVVVTGGDSDENGLKEPVYAQRLRELGIAANCIEMERSGRNTYRQAELTTQILASKPCDRILLVTSGLHMKRALLYFGHFGITPVPVASDFVVGQITLIPNSQNLAIVDIAVHQYIGIARLSVYNALGWNKRSR